MRTIYPKLITTLFIILLVALIVRHTGSQNQTSTRDGSQQLGYSVVK